MAFGFGAARIGPRTDVRYMTRFELFRSAGWFLRAGCLLGLLFVGLAYAGGIGRAAAGAGAIVQGAAFMLAVLTAMAFAGALYMDVRGFARSTAYNPAAVWHADHVAPERERLAIELHDSEVTRVDAADGIVLVRMEAYVHHSSAGEPGSADGTGWIHTAELLFHAARVTSALPVLPAVLADGAVELGERRVQNCLPLPLEFDGAVRFQAQSAAGEALAVEATSVSVTLIGDGQCIEIVRV